MGPVWGTAPYLAGGAPGTPCATRVVLEQPAKVAVEGNSSRSGRDLGQVLGLMARSLLLPTAPPAGAGVVEEPAGGISITYVGHATVLIRLDGVTLLTDPVYSSRLILPKRLVAPGVALPNLPALDIVLVSHAHMDHLDVPTHRRLPKRETVAVVAKDLSDLVTGCGYREILELGWGDRVTIRGVRITALPVKHWGTRSLWPDRRGYTGFLLEHPHGTVFFPGDTAYFPGFRDYGGRHAIDVALLPIGAYSPPSFRRVHMNPEDALAAMVDLGARHMVPIHWGTFVVSYEPTDEPVRWLVELARARGLEERVAVLRHGESRRFGPWPPRDASLAAGRGRGV